MKGERMAERREGKGKKGQRGGEYNRNVKKRGIEGRRWKWAGACSDYLTTVRPVYSTVYSTVCNLVNDTVYGTVYNVVHTTSRT